MSNNKAKNMTTGGILIALTIVILYLSILIPINTLALLTLSSISVPIAIIRCDLKTGVFVYIASSIISIFSLPIDTSVPYIIYFGSFGILKYFIEKINKVPLELILKLLVSNILIFIAYTLIKILIGDIALAFPLYIMGILVQVFILLYDYALTLIITYYLQRFHNKL